MFQDDIVNFLPALGEHIGFILQRLTFIQYAEIRLKMKQGEIFLKCMHCLSDFIQPEQLEALTRTITAIQPCCTFHQWYNNRVIFEFCSPFWGLVQSFGTKAAQLIRKLRKDKMYRLDALVEDKVSALDTLKAVWWSPSIFLLLSQGFFTLDKGACDSPIGYISLHKPLYSTDRQIEHSVACLTTSRMHTTSCIESSLLRFEKRC